MTWKKMVGEKKEWFGQGGCRSGGGCLDMEGWCNGHEWDERSWKKDETSKMKTIWVIIKYSM